MLSKLSWIFFVPFAAAAIFLELARDLFVDGYIFGLSDMMLDYAAIGCVLALFLFAFIFCVCDRKIAPYYLAHRNIPAGILGIISAVIFAADGANKIYNSLSAGNIEPLEMTESVLLLLTAIVFVVLGLTHSFRNRDTRSMAIFNVIPALMFAVKMVRAFVGFTTISITLADVSALVCYVFATLFFFNYAVAISLTEAKNAVKSFFIFGFPAVAAMLAYGVRAACAGFDMNNLFNNIVFIEMLLTALYILAFLIELTVFVKDRDHVIVVDDSEKPAVIPDESAEDDDSLVVTGVEDEDRPDVDSSYITRADTEGYLYRDTKEAPVENSYIRPDPNEVEGYITDVVDLENEAEETESRMTYGSRLDEIDKLILEITEDME